jgi:hypothetical protein
MAETPLGSIKKKYTGRTVNQKAAAVTMTMGHLKSKEKKS